MTTKLCQSKLSELDENGFEEWLCGFIGELFECAMPAQRNGGRGQIQHGVDVYARLQNDEMLGVQAKAYVKTTLTPALLDEEIRAAHGFNPELNKYIICTLNPRNQRLQERARAAKMHELHTVSVFALEDLAEKTASQCPRAHADLFRRTFDIADARAISQAFDLGDLVNKHSIAFVASDVAIAPNPRLKVIDDWIDAGQPRRALTELANYEGNIDRATRRRIEIRAHLALADPVTAVAIASAELSETSPSAPVLAYGAQAAEFNGDLSTADEFLSIASIDASEIEKAEIVACYLRVNARREGTEFQALEAHAQSVLRNLTPVALALADSAFVLGDLDAAIRWYRHARENRPVWPIGAQINAAGAEIWQLIQASYLDAQPVRDRLRALIPRMSELASEAENLEATTLRTVALTNLGHACRVAEDFQAAAAAWDKALTLPEADESLWLHRCVLCANAGIPLPNDTLIARWAVAPISRLVLAGALIFIGEPDRAQALIDEVLIDPTLSEKDRAIATIERIRLSSGGDDDEVTNDDVVSMLDLYDSGNRTAPLLGWLCFHAKAAAPDVLERLHRSLLVLAESAPIDPLQCLFFTENLIRAGLVDVTNKWLPDINRMAISAGGRVTSVAAARVLLRLYVAKFQCEEARQLITKLQEGRQSDPGVVLSCAGALEELGYRMAAYELLTESVRGGLTDSKVLVSWAKIAVVVKRRREAHVVMSHLELSPENATDFARIIQARALLGVRGNDQMLIASGAPITPETAGSLFGSGLLTRRVRQPRVAFGHIVQLRITSGETVTFDRRVVLTDLSDLAIAGVDVLSLREYPWIAELLDARAGEERTISGAPFEGQVARVVDVLEADRWSVLQALEIARRLPSDSTGVRAVSGSPEDLIQTISQTLQISQASQQRALQAATQNGACIALAAAVLRKSPRALLHKTEYWCPQGSSGQIQDIETDDRNLLTGARVVLDPLTVLLLVELDAERFFSRMPEKPAMTRQAAQQLFDWWYEHERKGSSHAGHLGLTSSGEMAVYVPTTADQVSVVRFWRRVRDFVSNHVEVMDPPPLANDEELRMVSIVAPSIISGLALARGHDWIYITEEPLVRIVTTAVFNTRVASVHRLLVIAAVKSWMAPSDAVLSLTKLVQMGWSWVSFPLSMIKIAYKLKTPHRWPSFRTLVGQLRKADPNIAVPVLFKLLVQVDLGQYANLSTPHVRELISRSFPEHVSPAQRVGWANEFARIYHNRIHRPSRNIVNKWANGAT